MAPEDAVRSEAPAAAGTPETRGAPAPAASESAERGRNDSPAPVPTGEPEAPVTPPSDHPEESGLPEPEPGTEPESPSGEDLATLSAKAQKADEYLELAQRTKADFENFRKRSARDAELAQKRGLAKLAKELLPAVDNLERALAHAPQAGEPELTAFLDGIEHLHTDLIAALARTGIERYSPEGEPFDPQHHEAVAQQPVEGAASGTVVEVYQRGYRIGELILRPARVLVAT